MKHGKKYVEAAKLVDRATAYEANDAVALVNQRISPLLSQYKIKE